MDLLGAYGSDSDGDDPRPVPQPAAPPKRSGLFAALPPPKNDGAPVAQQQAHVVGPPGRRVVAFTVPLRTDALTAPPDEDERPRKRAAVGAGPGTGLAALLPKPVHDDLGGAAGGTKLDLGGGSSAGASSQAAHPSLAFRVDAAPQSAGVPEAPHPSLLYSVTPGLATTAAERAAWAQQQAAWTGDAGGGWQQTAGGGGSEHDVDALLAQVIEEDRQRGGPPGSAAARLAALGRPQVVEVSQAQLTAGREKLLATKSVTGAAFGPEAEARLRAEAGPKPSDVQRRKHQIGSLLHDAKVQELKALEGRLQGMKTKRETMAKYGW